MSSTRLNEKLIDLMETLSGIMLKQGEPFRARAYQKAQETILSYPTDITSCEQLKGKPSIGQTILEKCGEFIEKGTLDIIEREKNNPATLLSDVYGIGPKKADELVKLGITTIEKLRENKHLLNDIQQVGLQYYEDILKRIPRHEIELYKQLFASVFHSLKTKYNSIYSKFEIVGSYRRGQETSGDIDVILTCDNPSIFKDFVDYFIQKKVIREVLSRGSTKCLVITKIPESQIFRRVDFLYTPPEEFPFAILYFTGSKIFNTVMRHRALEMGLTMNEHGLYKLEKDSKQKMVKGGKVENVFVTEKDIFTYLNLEYKTPEERKDGRAVKLLSCKKKMVIDETEEPEDLDIESKEFIETFKKTGIPFLKTLNETQLNRMYNLSNNLYRNQHYSIMTDNQFDILEDYIKKSYPKNKVVKKIGSTPIERNKVKLPYSMGSMDKIKPDTNALTSWSKKYKGPYVLSCKLDGVSGLYTTEGPEPKLYTRGDGSIGHDITHFIPYLRLPTEKGVVIRGEFIISKSVFEEKYKTTFANPRNMVAGLLNQKSINPSIIKDLRFVAYELIKPPRTPSHQLTFLSTLNMEVVFYKVKETISNELLSQYLVELRNKYSYEIDGIIVANDASYERKSGNPEHAFAFKMVLSEQIAEAKVVDVIWTPSKDGYLKPRVQIEPIQLGGVCIEYATGFNGSFIRDNKIGVGSLIEIIRSGDVIPHIRNIIVPAEQPKMPVVSYKWNETNVDIILDNLETDEVVREKILTGFFRGIGVDGLSSGNISRIVKAGFDSVPKMLKMSMDDFLAVDGFQIKMATKIYNGIREKLETASLLTLMSNSNIFGRGFSDKKIELILEEYPDILTSTKSKAEKTKNISGIKGMATKTAELFVERIAEFLLFLKECGLENKLLNPSMNMKTNENIDKTNPLFGKTVVMTGFRDTELQEEMKLLGAKIGSSVSKNTFVLLVKDKEEDTTKVIEAKKMGLTIMLPNEFREKFITYKNTQSISH